MANIASKVGEYFFSVGGTYIFSHIYFFIEILGSLPLKSNW